MEKEKVSEALHAMKEEYEACIYDLARALREGEADLSDCETACIARDLVSGLKSTLIDIGMLEDGSGYAYDDSGGSMRGGSMRNWSRDGSMRQGRTRTGRFKRSYDAEPENWKQQMQESINQIPDQQTRMDMQRMMDQMQTRM